MSYRALDDVDNRIMCAVQKIGARDGVQNVTAKKIAAECDISDFAVFAHFGTKKGYLDAAKDAFYNRYTSMMTELERRNYTLENTWDYILDDFVNNPDGPLYYSSYIATFGIDEKYQKQRVTDFLPHARRLLSCEPELTDDDLIMIWDYMTNVILYYAGMFARKQLEYNDNNRNIIKRTSFFGLGGHGIGGHEKTFPRTTNNQMTAIYTGFGNPKPYGKS